MELCSTVVLMLNQGYALALALDVGARGARGGEVGATPSPTMSPTKAGIWLADVEDIACSEWLDCAAYGLIALNVGFFLALATNVLLVLCNCRDDAGNPLWCLRLGCCHRALHWSDAGTAAVVAKLAALHAREAALLAEDRFGRAADVRRQRRNIEVDALSSGTRSMDERIAIREAGVGHLSGDCSDEGDKHELEHGGDGGGEEDGHHEAHDDVEEGEGAEGGNATTKKKKHHHRHSSHHHHSSHKHKSKHHKSKHHHGKSKHRKHSKKGGGGKKRRKTVHQLARRSSRRRDSLARLKETIELHRKLSEGKVGMQETLEVASKSLCDQQREHTQQRVESQKNRSKSSKKERRKSHQGGKDPICDPTLLGGAPPLEEVAKN